MLWQLGITAPVLPQRAADPNAPKNARPVDPADPEGNWTDALGHFVTRSEFGQWTSYDDDAGLAGGAGSPFGDYGPFSDPRYTDIELLAMRDGTPVRSPEDWWMKRRPEILRLVRDNLYGHVPDRWPKITWSVGAATTGTANGVDYQEAVITGNFDTSGFPALRDVPVITGTLRTPLSEKGRPVPVMVVYDQASTVWPFVASRGYGVFGYNPDGDPLGNWQITGGSGAYRFTIDRDTGQIKVGALDDLAHTERYTLTVIVSDGTLAAEEEVVTIEVPDRVNVVHHGRTLTVPKDAARARLSQGDAIGRAS